MDSMKDPMKEPMWDRRCLMTLLLKYVCIISENLYIVAAQNIYMVPGTGLVVGLVLGPSGIIDLILCFLETVINFNVMINR